MTKKEAIKELQETYGMMRAYNIDSSESILMTALNTAIEALEQEPCEDAISRQTVLDMMQMKMSGKELYKAVYDLPSVQPKSKTGHWIGNELGHCDNCGVEGCASDIWNNCKGDKYCPNCGAKIIDEEENKCK